MATISHNAIARAVYLASKDKGRSDEGEVVKKIVKFLFRRRLLSKSKDILLLLEKIINKEEGRVAARVTSVKPLDHKTKTHVEQALKKRYTAKQVIISERIDERLIGGLKIEINDEVIDLSIKNKIEKLKEHLIKSA